MRRSTGLAVLALARDPQNAALRHALGLLRARQRRFDEAFLLATLVAPPGQGNRP